MSKFSDVIVPNEGDVLIITVKKGVPTAGIDKQDLECAPFDELIILGFRSILRFGEAQAIMKLSIYATNYHVKWAADGIMALLDSEPRLKEAIFAMVKERIANE